MSSLHVLTPLYWGVEALKSSTNSLHHRFLIFWSWWGSWKMLNAMETVLKQLLWHVKIS